MEPTASPAEGAGVAIPLCASCEAPLHGRFCSRCGQAAHRSPRSLRTLVEGPGEGRAWLTVRALLRRPGFLTLEYLAGRRARWVPPLRLYLWASVLFFALAMRGGSGPGGKRGLEAVPSDPEAAAEARREVEQAQREVDKAADELEQAGQEEAAKALRGAVTGRHTLPPAKSCAWIVLPGERVRAAMVAACERAVSDEGRSLGRVFVANVPRTMFVFLPVVALAVLALHPRARRSYAEHLVFVLHVQAAIFVVFVVELALSAVSRLVPAVGVGRYRQALPAALLADLAGFAAAVVVVRLVFGP